MLENKKIKYITGDLTRDYKNFDVIIHGCNCFCTMGAGIAKSIKNKFPFVYEADCESIKGDESKLGDYTFAIVDGVTFINLYTQYGYSRSSQDVNYIAVANGFKKIKANFSGKKIAMPLIGCGLAGGDWNVIESIIRKVLRDEDVTIVIYEKDYESIETFSLLISQTKMSQNINEVDTKNYVEEIRTRVIEYNKTGDSDLIKDIPPEHQFLGLYPDKIELHNILPDINTQSDK